MAMMRAVLGSMLAVLAFAGIAYADDYPSKPVRIIVPYPAGATTDFMGRLFADYLRTKTDQPVIVENIGGASGTIGMAAAAKAPGDGYTLLIGGSAVTSASLLYKSLPFDPMKDLAPVGIIGRIPTVFAVHKDVPAKTLEEFVALAKKEPGKFNYVSPGTGTPPHIAPLELSAHYGIELVHVPYRGMAPAIADLIAGRGHLIGVDISPILQHIQNGTLRALAVAADKRLAALPDVPTASEAGFKGYEHYAWWGLFAPSATPAPIMDTLNKLMRAAVDDPAVQKKLLAYHVESRPLSRSQMNDLVRSEREKMGDTVTRHGIKVE